MSTSSTEHAPGLFIRGFAPPLRLADFKLIAFDMDSTLINIECVDEIADAAGRKAEVAEITEAAMRGEIADYKDSLRRRVALLKGVTEAHLAHVYRSRLRLNPGAAELVLACKAAGLKVLLVSGGFTYFAERLRDRLALDFARSNRLEIVDGMLTGRMLDQSWGDICDGAMKKETLLRTCSLIGCDPAAGALAASHCDARSRLSRLIVRRPSRPDQRRASTKSNQCLATLIARTGGSSASAARSRW